MKLFHIESLKCDEFSYDINQSTSDDLSMYLNL